MRGYLAAAPLRPYFATNLASRSIQRHVQIFKPILAGAKLQDRLVACIGAIVGIGFTAMICAWQPGLAADLPIIVAPIGASAVLLFAVPSSPLAQPWPVIGGNISSALIGVAVVTYVPNPIIAAAIAVGLAILVMSLLRCLHPPGGAAALTTVIGGQSIHAAGYSFAVIPVGINSIVIVVIAVLFHRASSHSYPHIPAITPATPHQARFLPSDIDAALEDLHDSFDIGREDIEALLENVERHASARLTERGSAGSTGERTQ